MEETPTKNKGGRPSVQIEIDWNIVDGLLEANCTGDEIAGYFGLSYDSLYNRCREEKKSIFSDYSAPRKYRGRSKIRFKQYDIAVKGDRQMLIWLGRNLLGQSENPTSEVKFDGNLSNTLESLKTINTQLTDKIQGKVEDKKVEEEKHDE
jgi:hypothetical protein